MAQSVEMALVQAGGPGRAGGGQVGGGQSGSGQAGGGRVEAPPQGQRLDGQQLEGTGLRRPAGGEPLLLGRMAGRSLVMQHLFARMRCTAPHFRLAAVEGEAGTGKLLLARTLHELGPTAGGPFIPAIAADFLENAAELWRQACGGLLYLTRVDELSGERQRQFREVLERSAHERVRTHVVSGPLQLLAGSAQPLRRLASGGEFRGDLATHLTAIRFALPPLRERREDIPLLAQLFLRRWSQKHGKPLRGFGPEAMSRLTGYEWPGNVRELEMAVGAAALECAGEWIRPIDLPATGGAAPRRTGEPAAPPEESEGDPNLDRAILRHVARVLARVNGNKVRAAQLLGISRSTLYRLLESGQAAATP